MWIIEIDGIKKLDGTGKEIDAKKLLRRLVSNSHTKLKTEPPDGYKTMMLYAERNPDLLKYTARHKKRNTKY